MTGAAADADLRPWAAYVVGHHPRTLYIWHELHWAEFANLRWELGRGPWDRIPRELEDLRRALRILAAAGRCDPRLHGRFRDTLEDVAEVHREVVRMASDFIHVSQSVDPRFEFTSAKKALLSLCHISDQLIDQADDLRPWRDFGDRVGFEHDWLFDENPCCTIFPEILRQMARELAERRDRSFPKADTLIKLVDELEPPAGLESPADVEYQKWALSRLDRYVRCVLKRPPWTEPILLLDEDFLIIHGERIEYAARRRNLSWFAILWVLAERVLEPRMVGGHAVKHLERQEIVELSGIETQQENLPPMVSKLRNRVLKPAIEADCARRGIPVPSEVRKHWYIGPSTTLNRKSNVRGATRPTFYELLLRPDQIRICCPRPVW